MSHVCCDPRSSQPARRRHALVALFVALLTLSTLPSVAVDAASSPKDTKILSGKVKDKKPFFWSGVVGPEDAPKGDGPLPCQTATCDHIRIEIALPRDIFSDPERPGGVQIALRWASEFDTLNIWVYKDGLFHSGGAGIIATAQSLLLPAPENGVYDVWVASDPAYNIHNSVAYEGLAEVEFSPAIHPVRRLLPDLVARPARTLTFDTPSFPLFEPDPPPGTTCFQSEVQENGAHNCLRADLTIANLGQAPLELRFAIPRNTEDPSSNVFQRVYRSDGSYADQLAGNWEYHPSHHHYHYVSFASMYLWDSNSAGVQIGLTPVRTSEKVSFCVADIEIDAWGKKGDGPRSYFAPNCLYPQTSDDNYEYLIQGLTNGWADVYEWYLPDQYVEVTNVADGYYVMEVCADPDHEVEELDETNNCARNHIYIAHAGTPQQSVTNLGPLP